MLKAFLFNTAEPSPLGMEGNWIMAVRFGFPALFSSFIVSMVKVRLTHTLQRQSLSGEHSMRQLGSYADVVFCDPVRSPLVDEETRMPEMGIL
jgi:hypothetical protein